MTPVSSIRENINRKISFSFGLSSRDYRRPKKRTKLPKSGSGGDLDNLGKDPKENQTFLLISSLMRYIYHWEQYSISCSEAVFLFLFYWKTIKVDWWENFHMTLNIFQQSSRKKKLLMYRFDLMPLFINDQLNLEAVSQTLAKNNYSLKSTNSMIQLRKLPN